MNVTTDPTALELDDIQSGASVPGPRRTSAIYFLLRIDERQAGRELMRRLLPALASAADPADPGKQAWVTAALTFQGLKALGVPQDSLDSFPPEFQQGMAARAADAGRHRRERARALGAAARVAGRPRRARRARARRRTPGGGRSRGARAAYRELPGVDADLAAGRHALPTERTRSASGTASATRPSRAAASPAPTRRRRRSRRASSSWATRTRPANCPRCPARGAGPQRHLRGLPQAAHARGGVPPVPARQRRRAGPRRSCWRAKFMGRWRSGAPLALRPERDDPELGADPRRNNAFLYQRGRRGGPQVPARRARPADESARRDDHRRGAAAPDDPARHQLRPDAARGRPGGRRRRPRDHVRLHRGAPGAAVRVRQDRVDERGHVLRRARREGPARRARTTGPASSPSPSSRSAGACTGLPAFVVNRGGEYCFMPGLSALRWLAELDT